MVNESKDTIDKVLRKWGADFGMKMRAAAGVGLYQIKPSDICRFKDGYTEISVVVSEDPEHFDEYSITITGYPQAFNAEPKSCKLYTHGATPNIIEHELEDAMLQFVEKIPENERRGSHIIGADFAKDTLGDMVMMIVDANNLNTVMMLKNPVVESTFTDSCITPEDARNIIDTAGTSSSGEEVIVNISGNRKFKAIKA